MIEIRPKTYTEPGHVLLTKNCIDHLQFRIEQEDFSSRLYLAMSLWLDNAGYMGAAKTWRGYAAEEAKHADWARTYLLSMGILPCTAALKQPQEKFTGLPEIIRLSHEHEKQITQQCNTLATTAFKEGDHMLYTLASKYLAEQVEELGKLDNLVSQLKSFGEDKIAMRLFDHELLG